jgi:hypothetical protein
MESLTHLAKLHQERASACKSTIEEIILNAKAHIEEKSFCYSEKNEILKVLNSVSLNPDFFVLDSEQNKSRLTAAKLSTEPELIELNMGSNIRLVDIKSVWLRDFPPYPDLSYLSIELAGIKPIPSISINTAGYTQYLIELSPSIYDEHKRRENREDSESESPTTARALVRQLKGDLFIFQSHGYYNEHMLKGGYQHPFGISSSQFHAQIVELLELAPLLEAPELDDAYYNRLEMFSKIAALHKNPTIKNQ